jgi:periplasmic protein TonB
MNRIRIPNGVAAILGAAALCLPLLAGAVERPLRGDPPEFPSEAARAGYDEGKVKVRLTVEPSGEVTHVEVVEASPRRVFDRATVRALSQWRYAAGGSRVVEMDLNYRR